MRVLLVEDHERLARLMCKGLAAAFDVDVVGRADLALEALTCSHYDAVVLDLGLPDRDGLDLLRELRRHQLSLPVLILTARVQVADRVAGLNAGADDYLTKPFAMEELVARLHAVLRRPSETLGQVLHGGRLALDVGAREARVGEDLVPLSRREMALLEQLLRRRGKVVPKSLMEESLYGLDSELSSNSVEVLVHRLRRKLAESDSGLVVHTVRGVGYMAVAKETPASLAD